MDYATTFSDYVGLESEILYEGARRRVLRPAGIRLHTIAMALSAQQLIGAWSVFVLSLSVLSRGKAQFQDIETAFILALFTWLYWVFAGVSSARWLTQPLRRWPAVSVLCNTALGAALASLLVARQHHWPAGTAHTVLFTGLAAVSLVIGTGTVSRVLLRVIIRRQYLYNEIVLLGEPHAMRGYIRHLREYHGGTKILAAFCISSNPLPDEVETVPVLGTVPDLLAYHARHPGPHVVLVTHDGLERLQEMLPSLRLQPLHVLRALPAASWSKGIGACGVPCVNATPLLAPPLRQQDHFIKATLDKLAGALALLLLAPVMLGCAIIIKLTSPGPVLYRQKRIGYRNNLFSIYKFRTMHVAACDRLTLTQRHDERIFAFGRLMRKLSLDELPQLFNVIRGEMSLVGPRPHMREAKAAGRLYYDIVPHYASRHRVKPGITGWAQINGWRGPTETDQAIQARVEHDVYYIENWSIQFDIKILLRTVAGGFTGGNAF